MRSPRPPDLPLQPPHLPVPLQLDVSDHGPGEENDAGWLISFVDLLTLLVTLFVLLLTFNHLPPRAPSSAAPSESNFTLPMDLRGQIEMLRRPGEADLVIKDDLLFDESSTTLKPGGTRVLDRLARLLSQNDYLVSVEGHTDDLPIHTERFPSNWELSTARAAAVTRYFIERGIAPSRLTATGYADTRPLAANDSAAGRARNRRVAMVVHLHSTSGAKGLKTSGQASTGIE